jgi:CBS domain-containing protein
MDNAIPTRIYEFLKKHPPFNIVKDEDLLELSGKAVVKYYKENEVVFSQGDQPDQLIYIVQEGAVHLRRTKDNQEILIDQCDEGDLFGLRPILAGENYMLSAIAAEESLLYALPVPYIHTLLESNPKVAWYMAQLFAAGMRHRNNAYHQGRVFTDQPADRHIDVNLVDVRSIDHCKVPVTCTPDTTIRQAAATMKKNAVGSIIVVNSSYHPIGIITDRDLRNKAATGEYSLDDPVSNIMSHPVITIPPKQTFADVQMAMMRYGIHHLCITESGTPETAIVGIVSEHDLLIIQGNNPALFIRELKRSSTKEDLLKVRLKAESLLHKYLLQEVSISFISGMITEVNDVLISRAVDLSIEYLKAEGRPMPNVSWCWLAIGSAGREEQLLRTDQDNALVFNDVGKSDYESTHAYFLEMAKRTNDILHYCGFEYCPAEMMAGNPQWCMSVSQWKNQFSKWMLTPTEKNVMMCTIFFDFRPVKGDFSLSEQLAEHIFDTIEDGSMFLVHLANNALNNPPPLTFFRNLMIEKDGEHKDEFDIKARAMMPLADAARILILEAKKPGINNTFHRFDALAELDPNNKELFQQAADAYEILMRYRALQGLKNSDSGRYFDPSDLTKMERLNLRNSFKPISELHDILKVRFRLNLMM